MSKPRRKQRQGSYAPKAREKSNFTKEQLEMKVAEQRMTIERQGRDMEALKEQIGQREAKIQELKAAKSALADEKYSKHERNGKRRSVNFSKEEEDRDDARQVAELQATVEQLRRENQALLGQVAALPVLQTRVKDLQEKLKAARKARKAEKKQEEEESDEEPEPEPSPRGGRLTLVAPPTPSNKRVRSASIGRPPKKELPSPRSPPGGGPVPLKRSKTPQASPRGRGKRDRARTYATPPPIKGLPSISPRGSVGSPKGDEHKDSTPILGRTQTVATVGTAQPSMADDPKFKKYATMKKIGMPEQSIKNKMRMDGFKAEEIDAFFGGGSGGGGGGGEAATPRLSHEELARQHGLRPQPEIRLKKVKLLKRFHWHPVAVDKVKKSIWESINKEEEEVRLGAVFELNFQPRPRKPKAKRRNMLPGAGPSGGKTPVTPAEKITWVPSRRDQSVQIGLRRVGMSNERIYDMLRLCRDEKLDDEQFLTLMEIAPTPQEQATAEQKAAEHEDVMDAFGVTEMFFLEMSAIPEVKTQLELLQFARSFRDSYLTRFEQVNAIVKSSQCIKRSKGLKIFFKIILSMGNMMNHGTAKGRAFGFDMDDLKLLTGLKDFGGKKTLAMHLCELAYNKYPESERLFKEVEILKSTCKMDTTYVDNSIKTLEAQFERLDMFMDSLVEDYASEDTSNFRFKMFQFKKENLPAMNRLKTKYKSAITAANRTADFLCFEIEGGKIESLFQAVHGFVEILQKAKDDLVKLDIQQKKEAKKRQRAREKAKRQKGQKDNHGKSVEERLREKQEAHDEEQKIGNRLLHDIRKKHSNRDVTRARVQSLIKVQVQDRRDMDTGHTPKSYARDSVKQKLSRHIPALGGSDITQIIQHARDRKASEKGVPAVRDGSRGAHRGRLPPRKISLHASRVKKRQSKKGRPENEHPLGPGSPSLAASGTTPAPDPEDEDDLDSDLEIDEW